MFAQKNCGVKPPNDLAEVKGRWKTAGKWHPAGFPNIPGQESRTAQAAECPSGVEAERPFYSTK